MVLSALVIAALLLPFAGAQGPSAPLKIGGDVKAPKVINKVEPKYTEEARAAKISGSVKLRVVVTKEGKADNIRVIESLDAGLDANAVDAIQQWDFQPATLKGQPVDVEANIEVNFKLK